MGAGSMKDKWVVMIYMAATSPRLCAAMERDLRELNLRLGNIGRNEIFVVVQADTPDGRYVTRQRLLGDGRVQSLKPQVLTPASPADERTAKQRFIESFLEWRFHNKETYPLSDRQVEPECGTNPPPDYGYPVSCFGRTLLILWGHSQGIAAALSQPGSPAFAMVGDGGFGYDPLFGDALTLPQIRCAIARGLQCGCKEPHRIDILSFDSCFMGAAEAAVELQEAPTDAPSTRDDRCNHLPLRIDYLLAAQTAILLDGLDYSRLADVFVPDSCVMPEEVGLRILSQAAYGSDSPTSLSLLRLHVQECSPPQSSSWPFEDSVRELVEALRCVLGVPGQPEHPCTRDGDCGCKPVAPPQRPDPDRVASNAAAFAAAAADRSNRAEWLRIRDAFEAASWHQVRQFVDVGDLCRRLANNSRDARLRGAAWRVLQELRTEEPHEHGSHPDRHEQPGRSFLVDVRSAHPLLLSGLSMYCPWLYPTPEETRAGAWNAVVSLKDYRALRFADSTGWGQFLLDAKVLIDESRQRSINAELEDVRRAIDLAARGRTDPPARRDFERFRVEPPKPADDRFQPAEPRPKDRGHRDEPMPSSGNASEGPRPYEQGPQKAPFLRSE
jgi:hypothetical protein